MQNGPSRFVRTEFKSLEPGEILTQPVDCLLGVTTAARLALGQLGIASVFDLGSSQTFATAHDILDAANGVSTGFARYGRVPGELVDDGAKTMQLVDLPLQSLDVLRNIDPALRETLKNALDIQTIRDLSLWPPYHAARTILSSAFGRDSIPTSDLESPPDLIPENGQYPTEKVQYEVLLFDEFVVRAPAFPPLGPRVPPKFQSQHLLGDDGPLDISKLLAGVEGYDRPAVGGVLTFTQSWYTKGLSLGSLIHGVALAPGESTKIAVIDWSRKTQTSATENITEGEDLTSDIARSRAINEITSAVAKETQEGKSGAKSLSSATQSGLATGSAGLRSPFDSSSSGGTAPGVETSGTSFGTSTGVTDASSWSTSSGDRDIIAALSQNIVDSTHQASHSARNRRASIVREVSQKESEAISTRTLTNYNHMHALTVEYYEVVQLYRTVVELSKADRCLFVPMKIIDFSDVRVINRYKQVIAARGLRGDVRLLSVSESDHFALWAPLRVGPWNADVLAAAERLLGTKVGAPADAVLSLPFSLKFTMIFAPPDAPFDAFIVTMASGEIVNVPFPSTDKGFIHVDQFFDGRLRQVRSVAARRKADAADFSGTISSGLYGFVKDQIDGEPWALTWSTSVAKGSAPVVLFEMEPTISTQGLMDHLQDNRLYYSQAIWGALDPATIGILLSGYTWLIDGQAKPLVELVDPTPVAIVANYIVLRMSGDSAKEHDAWLSRKKITVGNRREDTVPVPSGGVFAEAVLGRFNSAEKLDITRFWNWQDSPIPIQAPDIAAIQSGSRALPDNTVPGQLGAPVLNIVNPPALPDPQGMGAILAAIQNGNMFRDMSGLAATIGLAQAGLAGAQQGASDASTQAGKNAEVAAQLGAKIAEIVGKVIASYFGGGAGALGGGSTGSRNISEAGSKINQGKSMDSRGVALDALGGAIDGSAGPALSQSDGSSAGSTIDGSANQAVSQPGGSWEAVATSAEIGGGTLQAKLQQALGSLMTGGLPTQDLNATKAQLALAEKIIQVDTSKLGACSNKYLASMRSNIDASNLLGTGVIAGAIICWIPKDVEDLIIGPAHAAHGLEDVVEATAAIPIILKGTLRKQAQLALLTCKGLTIEEQNFWGNMDQLLA